MIQNVEPWILIAVAVGAFVVLLVFVCFAFTERDK